MAFILYAQSKNILKANNLKSLGEINSKDLNRIVRLGNGHLCLREDNLSFILTWVV